MINFAECLLTALDDQEVLEYAPLSVGCSVLRCGKPTC